MYRAATADVCDCCRCLSVQLLSSLHTVPGRFSLQLCYALLQRVGIAACSSGCVMEYMQPSMGSLSCCWLLAGTCVV